METGMIVIAAVIFAVLVIPTVLIIQHVGHQSKYLSQSLNTLVAQHSGVISQHTEHSNFALGLDTVNQTLYFFKKTDEAEISQKIDLSKVQRCEIVTSTKRIKKEKQFEELIETINLVFAVNNETTSVLLYNERDTLLTDELSIAQDWKKMVQELITPERQIAKPSVPQIRTARPQRVSLGY